MQAITTVEVVQVIQAAHVVQVVQAAQVIQAVQVVKVVQVVQVGSDRGPRSRVPPPGQGATHPMVPPRAQPT